MSNEFVISYLKLLSIIAIVYSVSLFIFLKLDEIKRDREMKEMLENFPKEVKRLKKNMMDDYEGKSKLLEYEYKIKQLKEESERLGILEEIKRNNEIIRSRNKIIDIECDKQQDDK